MSIFKLNNNDTSKLIQFTNDVNFSRNFKVTNFKKDDIYSLDYLQTQEQIFPILLKINSSFRKNIKHLDAIDEIENLEINSIQEEQVEVKEQVEQVEVDEINSIQEEKVEEENQIEKDNNIENLKKNKNKLKK